MCGIMGYIGKDDAYPIVLDGLKKLEYRGYDSAGIAVMNGKLNIFKKEGNVKQLENLVGKTTPSGNIALGHTRWATHGAPNDTNAHPHTSESGRLVMVHNGIIENCEQLKSILIKDGYSFKSETDSEILIQYFEWYQSRFNYPLRESIRRALRNVEGSYAIMVLDTFHPESIILAKNQNPLVFGIYNDEFYVASDASPISMYTQKVMYMGDGQIAELTVGGEVNLINLDNENIEPCYSHVSKAQSHFDLNGYDSYMLKEIFDQPKSIINCLEERINIQNLDLFLPEIDEHKRIFSKTNRIIVLGCGTSWHAGLIGEYLIESMAKINVEVEYASEFRYRTPIVNENDIVIALSQSGETADTLAALKLANELGAFTYSIVNTPSSSIARTSDIVSYLNVGVEIGVASTKAFTGQVTLLTLIALKLANLKGTISLEKYSSLVLQLDELPHLIQSTLSLADEMKNLAKKHYQNDHALFLGRGLNFPVALEGALKLKEISYIHAEGYPAAEMKHGPIALIDESMPVFVIATNNCALKKLISNMQEIKSRNAKLIVIKKEGDILPNDLCDTVITIPNVDDIFSPILSSIPLQLFSYFAAKFRKCNVDQPRNLAKSVTVE